MQDAEVEARPARGRWTVIALLMLLMGINYLDRANLSIAAPAIQKDFALDAVSMGYLFSAFGWTYTLLLPFAGVILDRVGPRVLYMLSAAGWSVATFACGLASSFVALLGCRIAVGAFESPALPTNVRVVTTWFPSHERAFAIGLYTAMQYATPALLTPGLAWILVQYGWHEIFYVTGVGGLVVAAIWFFFYRDQAAAIADATQAAQPAAPTKSLPFFAAAKGILKHRQVWGMFIGQFSVQTTLFFFLTWFPAYLINGKGLTILKGGMYTAIPFAAAVVGTLIAGKWSDSMVGGRMAGLSRKLPIIVGFALSTVIMGANFTNSIELILVCMSVAFFGQAMASTVTGALLSDIAPRRAIGTLGGLLYFVANIGGTSAPIIIGYMVGASGDFSSALVYVSVVAMAGVLSYLFVMGPTYRIQLEDADGDARAIS